MKVRRIENKLLVHLLFCVLVVIALCSGTLLLQAQGFRLGGWPMLTVRFAFFIICIYLGRWVCKNWFFKNSLVFFIMLVILACLVIALSWWLILRYLMGSVNAGFFEVLISAIPFFSIGLILGILLTMIRITMQIRLRQAQILAEQKQSELELLQSQFSPHFLFNTLNNLYGISLSQPSRIAKLLLQLSDLLRYAVYDTKSTYADINEEIKYIRNFIDFEKIRISDRLVLEEEIEDLQGSGIRVVPMIFIVFIENAFKHAKDSFGLKIFIAIRLYVEDDQLVFSVQNSFGQPTDKKELNKDAGLGLVNTIKRLELLYKDKYELKQYCEDQMYYIELRLPIRLL